MSTDLHTALLAAINARLGLARVDVRRLGTTGARLIVAYCERDLRVLKRHSPASDEPDPCAWCYSAEDTGDYFPSHPCPEITDLLDLYPVGVTQ